MRNTYKGEYHEHWDLLQAAIKAAAGHRCVRCHHPFTEQGKPLVCDSQCDQHKGVHRNNDPRFQWSIVQTSDGRLRGLNYGVHHFDGDKSNNRWWNLMALCNSCHLKIQSSVIPERSWLFEHSAWAKPYIGGFYAWWFAQEYPTREEVEADLEKYLALGQPWLYPHRLVAT